MSDVPGRRARHLRFASRLVNVLPFNGPGMTAYALEHKA